MTEAQETKAVQIVEPHGQLPALSVDEVLARMKAIETLMKKVMIDGQHYGQIPGTQRKTLYKAGAEKLSHMFNLAPSYHVEVVEMPGGHREYRVICDIALASTGQFYGQGVGSASTMESKHRYRWAGRKCPKCGAETIIKSAGQYGGGWYCFPRKGGCGAQFKQGDPQMAAMGGKVENPDPADVYNTCLKMAKKRSFTDAVLTVTAASDIFAPDDLPEDKERGDSGQQGKGKGKTGKTKSLGPLARELEELLLKQNGGAIEDALSRLADLTEKQSFEALTEGQARKALETLKSQPPQGASDGDGDIPF